MKLYPKSAPVLIELLMPTVTAQGKTIVCDRGANLREVLVEQGVDLYNSEAKLINCWGMGTCGTCAVYVEGKVSPKGWRERMRLALPPHRLGSNRAATPTKNRRLACQTQVLGDIWVTKFDGLWGQGNHPVWTHEG